MSSFRALYSVRWVKMRLAPAMWLLLLLCRCERQASEKPAPGASAAMVRAAPSSSVSLAQGGAEQSRATVQTWEYDQTGVGPMHVVVSVPAHQADERFPVLIALHGRGEAMKGPARGARGWIDDYGLNHAIERLRATPLTSADFGGAVDPKRLERLNRALGQHPYGGLIVVCPYTPDLLAGDRAFAAARPLTEFLVQQLLPRVYAETPALGTARSTGIDGVSLGGRASLLVGFERPEAFGAVAALQAAFDAKEIGRLVDLAARAKKKNPALRLRLLTSDADYFLDVNRSLSQALKAREVPHTLVVVRGDHSYEFNRGPGVLEMLSHHDWVLRGHATL